MNQKVVIWGASGHALVVADIIRLRGEYELVGFLDDVHPERHGTNFCGASILGGGEQLERLLQKGINNLILGFGDCYGRLNLAKVVCAKGFNLVTAIHPQTIVALDVQIGKGTMIAAGAVINPGTCLGENVIINTCASVDHECVIGNSVHICPGVHLAGNVSIEETAWVGIGATVINRIRIGARAVIGAGSVVVNDIPDGVVAYGVPAKVIRKTNEND